MPKRERKSVTVEARFNVEVPEQWIEFLTRNTDMFITNYSGYWMYGAEQLGHGDTIYWLAYEMVDERKPTPDAIQGALDALEAGKGLPAQFFIIDSDFARRAYVEGVKRWGLDWYEGDHSDSTGYDVVVQLAALGEIRYG